MTEKEKNWIANHKVINFTTKAEGKGTGIELYMSKQIADKMSARLTAQNKANGALF